MATGLKLVEVWKSRVARQPAKQAFTIDRRGLVEILRLAAVGAAATGDAPEPPADAPPAVPAGDGPNPNPKKPTPPRPTPADFRPPEGIADGDGSDYQDYALDPDIRRDKGSPEARAAASRLMDQG